MLKILASPANRIGKIGGFSLKIGKIGTGHPEVISEEQNMKTKVRLLNPTIYRSLITFYIFSTFKSRPNNQFNFDISCHEFRKINRIIKNYW